MASAPSPPVEPSPMTLHVNGTARNDRPNGCHSAYLRGIIEGRELDCLLDTGSEISLLPASLVPMSRTTSTSQTLTAANGTPIPTLGEATVSFSIGAYATSITGLVSDHIVEVMLGIEWLAENKAD